MLRTEQNKLIILYGADYAVVFYEKDKWNL